MTASPPPDGGLTELAASVGEPESVLEATSRRSPSARYMALSSATDLITTAVAFGTGLLIARVLGPHDRGVYTLITTIGMLVAFVAGAGIFESLLARATLPTRGHLRLATILGIGGALVMIALAVKSRDPLYCLYATFPVSWGMMQINLARAGIRQDWAWLYLRVIPSAIQIGITTAAWLTGHLTVFWALLAMIVGQVIAYAADILRNGRVHSATPDDIRTTLARSLPHHMLNLPRMANYRGPIIVLGLISTPTQVGLFAVASSVGSLVPTLTWSLTQNLLVLSSKKSSHADRLQKYITAAGYATSFTSAAACIFIGEHVLRLVYGSVFANTWPALVTVLAVQGLWLHSGVLEVRFRTAGIPITAAAIEVTGIVAMCVIMTLTSSQGYMSAAYGTATTCIVTLVLCMLYVRLHPQRFESSSE